MDNKKIVLIDGHSILNRAYYGIPLLTSSDGVHTNAVYGFLNILFRVLEEESADYLAVAFDLHAPTFRHKMYAAYKGTRHPMPDELREQVPLMKQMLTAMNVPLMMLEGYEADDLLGTVSLAMEEEGLEVRIISGDRDLLQLASDHTEIRIPKTKAGGTEVEDYFAEQVKERYQVTPTQFIDVKALMGDASDNIPGIPGVGEKTAMKIIAEYGSIENAHQHVEEIKPNRAKESLRNYWDQAVLSKTLATIDRHAPFVLDLDSAELGENNSSLYTEEALLLCRKLGLKTLVKKFSARVQETAGSQPGNDAADGFVPATGPNPFVTEIANVDQSVQADVSAVSNGSAPASDLAMSDENLHASFPGMDERIGLQVVYDGSDLVGMEICDRDGSRFFEADECDEALKRVAAAPLVCAIDLKEQMPFLRLEEEHAANFFDCAVGAYLLNPLTGSYLYEDIARDYLDKLLPSSQELMGKKSSGDLWNSLFPEDKEIVKKVAAFGAETAFASMSVIAEKLCEEKMDTLFRDIEMPMVFTLHHMQQEGILVKADELRAYGQKLAGRIQELEKEICDSAGQSFNINSPKQLGKILFEDLKLPYGKKTKTGYSTAADVLEKLAPENRIVQAILEYRQLTKLKSTYADGLAGFIADDGRIHGKFNQTVTATGRISSADPNLQNIPVRTELGRQLRKVFVAKEGYCFVDADYSQIELRVLAHMSGDRKLIEAYNSAEDIHAITASQVFHVPLDEVTPQLRRNAKAVNFGIIYGQSSFGLSQGLSISRQEAASYIEQYFLTYPGIKAFLDGCVSSAKEKGYSVTLFGRRRPVPELQSKNFMQRSFGERVAMNAPIQGTAADIIKVAMVAVDRRLRREGYSSRLVLQVHDELLVETKLEEEEAVKNILREEMMGAAKLAVPLEIGMESGPSWYDAH